MKKGFTLVEMLVVVAIIGVLATLSVVYYIGGQAKANDARVWSDAVTAQKAAVQCYLNGWYIGNWGGDPETLPGGKNVCNGDEETNSLRYIAKWPIASGKSGDGGTWRNCDYQEGAPADLACSRPQGMNNTDKTFQFTLVTGAGNFINCTERKCTKNF